MPAKTIPAPPEVLPKDDEPMGSDLESLNEYEGVFAKIAIDDAKAKAAKLGLKIEEPAPPATDEKPKADTKPPKVAARDTEKGQQTAAAAPDDVAPEGLSEKGKADFKILKERHKSELERISSELKAAQAELNKAKANTPSLEMERLKKERDELVEQVRILNVQELPEFKQHFDQPAEKLLKKARDLAGDRSDELESVLRAPPSKARAQKLNEIMDGLGNYEATQVANLIGRWDDLMENRQTAIESAKKDYDLIQERRRTEQNQKHAQYLKAFDAQIERASDPENGLAPFQLRDGDDEWNKSVEERKGVARAIFTGNFPPDELSKWCLWAAAGPSLAEGASAVMGENAALKAELEKIKGVTPKPGAGKVEPSDAKKYQGPDAGLDAAMDEIVRRGLLPSR